MEERIKKIEDTIQKLKNEKYKQEFKELSFSLTLNKEPTAYARARKGRGGFYNPKAKETNEFRKLALKELDKDLKNKIDKIFAEKEDKEVYVLVSGKFYISIPKSDSLIKAAKKEMGLIRPTNRRGDSDNYMKLILDALHEVIYEDDCYVVKQSSEKYYSLYPRVVLDIKILYEE